MADFEIEISGFDGMDQIGEFFSDILQDISDDIENTTKSLVPVRTGALQKSISVMKISEYDIEAVASEDYASYVDEGTSRMSAQPFFSSPINDIIDSYDFDGKLIEKASDLFD